METLMKRVKILEQLDNQKKAKLETEQRMQNKNQSTSRKLKREAVDREKELERLNMEQLSINQARAKLIRQD